MQDEWWYSKKDSRKGPVPVNELRQMLIEGTVTTSTLVWKEGMPAWAPLAEVPELNHIARSLPPELPRPSKTEEVITLPFAGPWRRFFARIIDFWVIGLPTAFLLGYVLSSISLEFAIWVQKPGSDYVFGWLLTPVILVIEGAIFGIFGATLGKWLLGIKVTTASDQRPTARQYFQRQIGVFWYGLGTGFPLVSLFTMAVQHGRVKANQPAKYDVERFNVRASRLGPFRVIAAALIVFAVMVMNSVLQNMSARSGQEADLPKTGAFDDLIPNATSTGQLPPGMARFRITSPDGKQYLITAPEGATQEEALAYAKEQLSRDEWTRFGIFVDEPKRTDRFGGIPVDQLNPSEASFDWCKYVVCKDGKPVEYVSEDEVFGRGKVPKVGTIENGYEFLGGDPSKEANWRKVQKD